MRCRNSGRYETTNNGRWYEFGFMLGIGAYAGSEAANRSKSAFSLLLRALR